MAKDMREWIAQLDKAGELHVVTRAVDPRTEMGALLYQSREKGLLFQDLTGYPGWRALGQAPANPRHAAIAFDTTLEQLVPRVADLIARTIPPRLVDTGPVKEVITRGADVNLLELPAHQAGVLDSGPFIASGLIISKDPDTGRRNLAFHRLQVKGRNRTGILLLPRHTYANYRKYEAKGEAMPVAIVIGHHPLYYMAAAVTGPYGFDELEVAGSFLGEPVPLVKCETVDHEVPADAEIVLEGHIPPHVREEEGPFSEFQDYYVAGMGKNPIVELTAMTRRRDAIFKALQNGSEVEGCVFHKIPMSATIYRRLKNVGGFVDLKNVMVLPGIFSVVVQLTQRLRGEAKQVLLGALAAEYLHPKVAIAVDEDVNVFNPAEILWAISTRVDPAADITVIPGLRGHPMDPTAEEIGVAGQSGWQRLGSKVLIDATRPPLNDPDRRSQFERIKPPNLERVRLEDYVHLH
ncbi:MAG: UbiD family decarboxylase [Candidatus Rokubacteria bacterium]|nr:UbiD family decarboxylase [Candidatus Rokubacteria bacterium]